jgi:uncharacterized membrane protein YeaQ/YmgE (transglycosylase-associated protein family)
MIFGKDNLIAGFIGACILIFAARAIRGTA